MNTRVETRPYPGIKHLRVILFLISFAPLPLHAAELVKIENVTLVEADLNDGDSFKVYAEGRELHLRLYYVDCPETTFNGKSGLYRIREQQYHFGLEDPQDVMRFGKQATEFVRQLLSHPFTVYTSYAQAPGRSASGRFYAFVETQDGHDLAALLIERGLARIHGSTRPGPDGAPSDAVLEQLHSLRTIALLNRAGIWQSTKPQTLAEMHRRQREADRELNEFRSKVTNVRTLDDQPIDLNTASKAELQQIPGIGPVTAVKIIEGKPYEAVDDLVKIRGIGPESLEAIAPYVTIQSAQKKPE